MTFAVVHILALITSGIAVCLSIIIPLLNAGGFISDEALSQNSQSIMLFVISSLATYIAIDNIYDEKAFRKTDSKVDELSTMIMRMGAVDEMTISEGMNYMASRISAAKKSFDLVAISQPIKTQTDYIKFNQSIEGALQKNKVNHR